MKIINLKQSAIFSLLLVLLFFVSCEEDNFDQYEVDNTLDEYLQRFLNEASIRGKTFDLETSGLKLGFGTLKDGVGGVCYHEKPIRVVIDEEYWESLSGYADEDYMKENLVFHELGHGLLDRRHDNTYLSNGDWKSMMCGGDVKDNRSWNINYRRLRQKYYLDELFNPNTGEPSWATKILTNPKADLPNLIQQKSNFSIENTHDVFSVSKLNTHSLDLCDFYIESRLKITGTEKSMQAGLFFGSIDPIGVEYFLINRQQHMFMGNTECYGWHTDVIKKQIKVNDYNTIGLRRKGNTLYYYINDECVYYDVQTEDIPGEYFGLELASGASVSVEYVKIYANTSLRRAVENTPTIELIEIRTPKTLWK